MTDQTRPPRRVRWYDLLTPMLGTILLPVLGGVVVLGWDLLGHHRFDVALLHDFYFLCLIQLLSQLGMLAPCLWVLARVTDPALPARFVAPGWRALAWALAAAVALMAAMTLFEYLCDTFLHTHLGDDAARLPIAPHGWRQLPLGLLVIAVLGPLAEEAYFRGLVLGWGRRHGGRAFAILLSSLLFGLVHLKWWTPGGLTGWLLTAELALMGAALALVAMRTGSLWASAAMHALNNVSAVVLLFLFSP